MDTLRKHLDLFAAFAALLWTIAAAAPWWLGPILRDIIHPGASGGFAVVALLRGYRALGGAAVALVLVGCLHAPTVTGATQSAQVALVGVETIVASADSAVNSDAEGEALAQLQAALDNAQAALDDLAAVAPVLDAMLERARQKKAGK